jgi:osmotically-inducible protein OsmY
MTDAVRAALAADKTPTLNHVNASAHGGYIILTGWANLAAAERARQIAERVPGVRGVVDQMEVPEPDPLHRRSARPGGAALRG